MKQYTSMLAAIVSYLLLLPGAPAQELILEGRVIDDVSGKGLAYAHVGVTGTSTGTVTDSSGYYYLEVPAVKAPGLSFSHVGYLGVEVPFDSLLAFRTIPLSEAAWTLPECTVSPEGQGTWLGKIRTVYSGQVNYAMHKRPDQNLGSAVGRVFEWEGKAWLDSLSFFIAMNDFPAAALRVQCYSVRKGKPDQPLYPDPLILVLDKGQRGWVSTGLPRMQVTDAEEVLVALEWVATGGPGSLLTIPVHFPFLGESHYYRYGAQNSWKQFRAMATPIRLRIIRE